MSIRFSVRSFAAVALLACAGMAHAAPYQFNPLGQSIGQNFATGLSSNGQNVVGVTDPNGQFFWSQSTGFVAIPEIPGGQPGGGRPSAVSNTGRVTGFSNGSGSTQAYAWSAGTGTQALGYFPSTIADFSEGAAISDDGSLIAGTGLDNVGNRSFRYDTSLNSLGSLPGTAFDGNYAYGISGDGQTVVGRAFSGAGLDVAYKWTAGTGMVALPNPAGYDSSFATAISPDAQYVVGTSFNSGSGSSAGLVNFGGVSTAISSALGDVFVNDVSNTGVVVGRLDLGPTSVGFVWSSIGGLIDLNTYMADTPAAAGWNFISAGGISADGNTLLVVGINPSGQFESALVTIPAPGAGVMALAGLAAMARRRRR